MGLAGGAWGQNNPVFVDDSTLAGDVLGGLPGLLASDNEGEAVRLLQRLLEEEGERLTPAADDPDLLGPVRSRVHEVLLGNERLLARYRTSETDRAQLLLEAGRAAEVERAWLLTRPGFEAALQVAADHLASGRFESARLTLEQLERHPDASQARLASRASALWRDVAAYLPRAGVVERARAWASRAGESFEAPAPVSWPESLRREVASPQESLGAFDLADLLPTPLVSTDLRPEGVTPEAEAEVSRRRPGQAGVEFPFLYPVVSGGVVYTNDGLWISAWDRFTLTPLWRTRPRGADLEREELSAMYGSEAYRRNRSRDAEESNVVALSGRLLLATTGVVADGSRSGDPRLHALDARTGRVLWSSYIDELDGRLEQSSGRGPALFEGDTAVVAVRKIDTSRRFASAYLVGVDLADGSARWVRLCGSAGWLSYGGRGQWSDWPTMHEGVVYRVDELGVICAVEAGSGRFVWVRRLPGVESRMPTPRLPWTSSTPVIDGDSLLTLSPDRSTLLRLGLSTGRVRAGRDAGDLGNPGYIFGHAGRLVAVSPTRMASMALSGAPGGGVRLSRPVASPGLMGRVVAGGDALLAPLHGGVGVLDLETLEPVSVIELSSTGTSLPLGGQLLTLDNQRLHSYLVWEDAARVLGERLEANPGDAETAITFAELAARAGRPGAVLGPVDRALAAMAADPLAPSVRVWQRRLFALLLDVLSGGVGEGGAPTEVLEGAAARMELVAVSAEERAAHRLHRAHLARRLGRPAEAVSDCQAVLADEALSAAAWSRGASSVRAEREALEELDRALAEAGPGAYGAYGARAAAELASLREGGEGPAFERLARAYPRSGAALEAWLEAARAHRRSGLVLPADRALARGLEAAAAMRGLGVVVREGVVGELAGLRVRGLVEMGRVEAARSVMERVEAGWPGVGLTADGEALSPEVLAGAESGGVSRRLASVGDRASGEPVVVRGWVQMRALDRRGALWGASGVVMHSADEVGLWRGDGSGGLVPVWTSGFSRRPALVRADGRGVLLLEPSDGLGVFRMLDASDGRELWRNGGLAEALATARGAPGGGASGAFESPLDGRVDASDVVLALGEAMAVVVTRQGRAAALDLATGRVVWSVRTEAQRVHDAAAGEGVVVLGGTSTPPNADSVGEPVVLVLDLATGELLSRHAPGEGSGGGDVRWVRVSPDGGRVFAGLARGLVSLSLPDAEVEWSLAEGSVEQTTGVWVGAGRLFVQTEARELALVDAGSGALLAARLDTAGTLALGEPIDALVHGGRLWIVSPAGFASLDAETGELASADAVEPLVGGMTQAALGEGRVVMVEREPAPGAAGSFRMHVLDAETGRAISTQVLAVRDRPRRVRLLDGLAVVSTTDSTVAVPLRE